MALNQAYLFLIFALNGIIIGIFFDSFRILRKVFYTYDFITYIEDAIFLIISGVSIFMFAFIFNNGEFRAYMFISIIIGLSFYLLLFSKYIMKISIFIINIINKIIKKLIIIIIFPFCYIYKLIFKIFLKPFSFVILNFKNIFKRENNKTNIDIKNLKTSK